MSVSSHQSPLLWMPLKQTDEVDVAAAVRSRISASYGEDTKNYSSSLITLARARTEAVRNSAGSELVARDLLFKWFHILEMLEVRFPELRVPFTWKDAFTGKSITQSSIAYEKAGVIFNTAATLSMIAASTSRLGGTPASSSESANGSAGVVSAASPTASSAPVDAADGTKRAYTALRQAAGFFNYINENFLHAPSTDMSRPLLRFIVPLLLTQANEVFLERTLSGKSSAGLVSKLASGVAAGYAALVDESKEWGSKDIVDRTWTLLISAKAKHFSSVAQYYRAQADSAAGQHGHSLVRLTLAESLSKEAVKLANQFGANHTSSGLAASASATLGYTSSNSSAYTMPADASSALVGIMTPHLAIVSEKRAQAVKDNDLIYHDILPSESTLPAIDKTQPAQPTSIQEVYSSPEVQRVIGPDLFAKLVPLGVHERASMYSEEKAKLARAEAEKCDLAEGERVAALDAMGLPASLERFKMVVKTNSLAAGGWETLADPGSEVMTWANEESSGGPARGADSLPNGSAGVTETIQRITNLRQSVSADLKAASDLLDEEWRSCEKTRVKYGHKFAQEPSGGQSRVKDLRSEIKSNKEALQQAEANDGRIEAKWQEVRSDVELLGRGRGALEQTFAEALAGAGDGSSGPNNSGAASLLDLSESEEDASTVSLAGLKANVEALESALVKLGKVKKEREALLAELREKLQSDDIGHLLILSHRGGSKSKTSGGEADTGPAAQSQAAQEAALFRQELEKFRPWQNRLNQAMSAQAHLLGEITRLWQAINTSPDGQKIGRQWDVKNQARQRVVARLRTARDANAEVRAALGKGLQFYEELGELSRGLKNSARSWNQDRAREREAMERNLEWDSKLDQPGGNSSSTAGLERSMGSLGLNSGGAQPAPAPLTPSYGYSPAPSTPSYAPRPPRSYASPPPAPAPYASNLPPPPSQPTYSSLSARSPPPQSPYDFGSFGNNTSGPFSSGPPASSYGSAPPPGPRPGGTPNYGNNQSFTQQPSYAGMRPPPPQQPQRQSSYGYAAPATPSYQQPAPQPHSPAPQSGGYQPYPPPPPSASSGQASYGGYPSFPQQQSKYGQAAPPPPPPSQNQQQFYGQYGQQPQQAPPPPQQQQQGYNGGGGYGQPRQWNGY